MGVTLDISYTKFYFSFFHKNENTSLSKNLGHILSLKETYFNTA